MPSLKLKIRYNKNEGILISPSELQELYLFGIPSSTDDGRKMPSDTIKRQIIAAQKRFENLFSIKLAKQVVEESRDFTRQEWDVWGYVKTTYPVMYPDRLKGYINDACQVNYPHEWLSVKKTKEVAVFRNIYVIPNSAGVEGAQMTQNSIVYNGVYPHLGWFGKSYIPNYWRMKYITGWDSDELPEDLTDVIAKYAAINVLAIISDFLYGVGIQSISVSLDGVSQSTPLTKGGQYGMFSSRIKLYIDDINAQMENMKFVYKGIIFEVL